jgi:hypothetical protein
MGEPIVALPVQWRKSSHSTNTESCVELSNTLHAMRDSKNPDGPVLSIAALTEFVRMVRSGQLDR